MPLQSFKIPRYRIMTQTVVWFLLISLIPLGVATYLTFWYATQSMREDMLQNLHAMAQRQAHELKTYIWGVQDSVMLLAANPNVVEALTYLNTQNSHPIPPSEARKLFDAVFTDMLIDHDYKTLILVDPQGRPLYGIGQYGDVRENLLSEKWLSTSLGIMLENTLMTMSQQVSSFEPLSGNVSPTLFTSCPVLVDKKLIGVVIVQVKNESIFKIVNNYAGLGETGETIISKYVGDDIMILNPVRHQNDLKHTQYNTAALKKALSGQSGVGQSLDYRDEAVWTAWEYIPEHRWGVLVKKDVQEADKPIARLKQLAVSVLASTFIVVFVAAIFAAQTITQPIVRLTRIAERIAQGDLKVNEVRGMPKNEIGVLAKAISLMVSNLKLLINEVKASSQQVISINSDIALASERQSDAVTQTMHASDQIKLSSKEMSTTTLALSAMMEEVNRTIQETALQAKSGLESLTMMESNMQELTEEKQLVSEQLSLIKEKTAVVNAIIATMTKVANQTNLLSINAAIQVKQAGDAGRGFNVVATKIRQLADQAAQSTLEIEKMTQDMEMAVQKGVKSMGHFSNKMAQNLSEISSLSHYLARVIVEVQALPGCFERVLGEMQYQSKNASQIKFAISKMNENVQYTASVLKDSRNTLTRLQSSSDMLQKEIERFVT